MILPGNASKNRTTKLICWSAGQIKLVDYRRVEFQVVCWRPSKFLKKPIAIARFSKIK